MVKDNVLMGVEGNKSNLTSVNADTKSLIVVNTPTCHRLKPWYFKLNYVYRDMEMKSRELVFFWVALQVVR